MSHKFTFFRHTVAPLFLMLVCPPVVILFWYTNVYLDGSLLRLWELFRSQGFFSSLYAIWSPIFLGSATAWKILAIFWGLQLFFMKALPGKIFNGPLTPKGNTPLYKTNGIQAFASTLFLFYLGAFQLNWFSPGIIYDHFGELLGALNIFSLLFCLILLIKGYVAPSSTDCGSSGNPIFDYYWGTELYPRLFGWDVKMFTNCRFGMMGWALIILSFAAKQKELYGEVSNSMLVSVALQLIYITKFFFWETGYLKSLDIMHDRAGYYICWGCLVWVPGIYTSATLYLVGHPNVLNPLWALSIFVLGAGCILINYLADSQRQTIREKNGACRIWGRKPEYLIADYITESGERKQSILLVSGWWGIARHFHYVPEILGAFFWTLPALFSNFLPYFYVIFLMILLIDRAYRDDARCSRKYGLHWKHYCQRVPYKIIPFRLSFIHKVNADAIHEEA